MRSALLTILLLVAALAVRAAEPAEGVQRMAVRLMGKSLADHIEFRQIEADGDVFELRSDKSKIIISGNSANSMAMGLGHYLRYCCHVNVSWDADEKVAMLKSLPPVDKPLRRRALVEHRFFLNYCTFGYTMVWWQWREWERFIDWMALNGINLPLAITGQESVWYRVWTRLGLTDEEVRSYFTGPAHLPWHRMINLDRWQGPLPMAWLEHQEMLQKNIVERERELGMRPVLPAFAGHVPEALKRLFPEARISRMSSWGGFRDDYRSFFLGPMDSLFARIQTMFMEEQTMLYGTDHVYGIDPFNEVDPPSWEPDFLAEAARTIYSTLTDNDPQALWVQMTWLFYIDQAHWTQPRIKAFLGAVPRGRLLLLDYFAENTEVWRKTDSYYGQPFVWCYLGNFGGNTMLAGNMAETGQRIASALADGGCSISGIGSTLEAMDCNPLMYEYVLDNAWSELPSLKAWVDSWADRRVGKAIGQNREAWQLLVDSVYTRSAALGQAPLTNARPSLKGHGNWTTNPAYHYNNKVLYDAWRKMTAAAKANRRVTNSLAFDLVNVGRQFLSNHFMELRDSLAAAYSRRDIESATAVGMQMETLLSQLDSLLTVHPYFSLQRWVDRASAFGVDAADSIYYRRNAKTLLTTWGEAPQSLNDYASRTWAGLVSHYYQPRWHELICEVLMDIKLKQPFDQKLFNANMWQQEQDFVNRDQTLYTRRKTVAKPLDFMERLQHTYAP